MSSVLLRKVCIGSSQKIARSTANSRWNPVLFSRYLTALSKSNKHYRGSNHGREDNGNADFRANAKLLAALAGTVGISLGLFNSVRRSRCEGKVGEIAGHDDSAKDEKTHLKGFEEAINKSRDLIKRVKDEVGSPGIVIGVSVDGEVIWKEGFGYADVENRTPCSPDTVMRIASISKSITTTIVAKLWEMGKLDLDKPVQFYLPKFPEKTFEGEKVTITTRHLLSHLSGIRHYSKKPPKKQKSEDKNEEKQAKKEQDGNLASADSNSKQKTANQHNKEESEFELKEMLMKDHYKEVTDSLALFKDDPLLVKPGSQFLYSTHGFTLLSAVAESASGGQKLPDMLKKLFVDLGLQHTYLDLNTPLIYHRSRFYKRNKKGQLENVPYVDNSYKWAGGGLLSNVGDLLRFANIMLYSYQFDAKSSEAKDISTQKSDHGKNGSDIEDVEEAVKTHSQKSNKTSPGYLKQKTVQMMWTEVLNTKQRHQGVEKAYGMGWQIQSHTQTHGHCRETFFTSFHTGAAAGASSVLVIVPEQQRSNQVHEEGSLPKGVAVAILTNLEGVSMSREGQEIAKTFMNAQQNSS